MVTNNSMPQPIRDTTSISGVLRYSWPLLTKRVGGQASISDAIETRSSDYEILWFRRGGGDRVIDPSGRFSRRVRCPSVDPSITRRTEGFFVPLKRPSANRTISESSFKLNFSAIRSIASGERSALPMF